MARAFLAMEVPATKFDFTEKILILFWVQIVVQMYLSFMGRCSHAFMETEIFKKELNLFTEPKFLTKLYLPHSQPRHE